LLGIAFVRGFNYAIIGAQITISKPSVFLTLKRQFKLVFVAGTIATWIPAYQNQPYSAGDSHQKPY